MKKEGYILLVLVGAFGIFLGAFSFSDNGDSGVPMAVGSDECQWENRNQEIYSGTVYRDIGEQLRKGGFMAPLNLNYKEVEFTEFGIVATNNEYQPITFKLNDVDCGEIKKDIFAVNDFSSTCLSALKEGMNSFDSTEKNILIHEIYVGFRYKPANCEK